MVTIYNLDVWREIMSRCDSISLVNLILSNKYLYDNFKERLKDYRYITWKVLSRQTRGLNFYKSPLIWKKMDRLGICVNKVYINCSRGGSAKMMWVNLRYGHLCEFLKFMGTNIIISQDKWPERINVKNIDQEIMASYISHIGLVDGVNKIEWDDSLVGRSLYLSHNKILNDIINNLDNKLYVSNDSFDMDMYCSIKSRRRIRLQHRQKMKQN